MILRFLRLSLCLGASMLMTACGVQKDLVSTDGAVSHFHQLLDAQDYGAIYAQTNQQFRDATKQDEFTAILAAVHRKLGHVGVATRQGFNINYDLAGAQIRVNYSTKFAEGDAQEEFVWRKSGETLALSSYNINSNALITK